MEPICAHCTPLCDSGCKVCQQRKTAWRRAHMNRFQLVERNKEGAPGFSEGTLRNDLNSLGVEQNIVVARHWPVRRVDDFLELVDDIANLVHQRNNRVRVFVGS